MATIRVMSGGAPREVFAALTPRFEQQSGHKVVFSYAVMSALRERLAAGEKTDVLVMPVPLLDGYVTEGKLHADGRGVLGTVLSSVVVREGAPRPDISTADKFRQALSDAKSIVHATPGQTPSGTHLGKLMDELGIAKDKIVHRSALAGGIDLVVKGEADLGIYPTSEVVGIPGLAVVGPLPGAAQLKQVYGAAVASDTAEADAAQAFIAFVTAAENRAAWTHGGFETA
ncbi:MAG TPA: substrate-binding domain-containing protein [Pseudolabrys sp.]|jgi:molybdate transport system substrate-binding protein|nr:substrate-binding domain-containing protein [Pseudolabrys sp.]